MVSLTVNGTPSRGKFSFTHSFVSDPDLYPCRTDTGALTKPYTTYCIFRNFIFMDIQQYILLV